MSTNNGERIAELQAAMARDDVDCVVLRLAENVVLTTDYYVQIPGLGLVVVPREGAATLLVPAYEVPEAQQAWSGDIGTFPAIRHDGPSPAVAIADNLERLARQHGVHGGRIGYEGSFESIAPASIHGEPNAVGAPTQGLIRESFGARELVDVTETLEAMRAVKNAHDLARLRRVNAIAALGLNAFKEVAVAGRTEVEIMALVENAIATGGHGLDGARVVRGFATIASGPRLIEGWQYWRSSTRRVEEGDIVMLEMGTVADGYWCDHTRTVVAGTASDRQREAFTAVLAANDAAFAAAVPGATGDAVDARSREAMAAHGFTQFPHHTGHGTGFRYHESRPQLSPGSAHVLQAGNVIVTEPGVYGEELQGGVRHEDNAVVTANGAERLVATSYGLD